MGWLYTRLVASNSGLDVLNDPVSTDHVNDSHFSHECTPLLSKSASAMLNNSIQEFMAMLRGFDRLYRHVANIFIISTGNSTYKSN